MTEVYETVEIPFINLPEEGDVQDVNLMINPDSELKPELAQKRVNADDLRPYLADILKGYGRDRIYVISVFFITRTPRAIGAQKFVSMLLDAGKGVCWAYEGRVFEVRWQQVVQPHLPYECERTIVYVASIEDSHVFSVAAANKLHSRFAKHFAARYDEYSQLQRILPKETLQALSSRGFFKDDRFFEVPGLDARYRKWLEEQEKKQDAAETDVE